MKPGGIINGRYLLVRSIGRGSFGEVWLATDQKLGLDVAIKIYIPLDTRGIDEFKNEFKSVYNLHHTNLLRADYFDLDGNNPFLVMPYCPLSVIDEMGKMSEDEIWRFIKDVTSGIAYLHSNDIIHRDIKPDNILKDGQGNYVITDFGLSTKLRSTLRKASARQNMNADQSGTIGYMAPEMFSAHPNAVKATDIWALGATIYEIATGEMPFCGQGGVMELHGAEIPDLPSNFGSALTGLMRRCLAKDPWERPTAKEINEIAQSVAAGGNRKPGASSSTAKRDCEKYKNEIARLNNKISEIEKNNATSDVGKLITGKKKFKTAFWALFAVSILSVSFLLYINATIVKNYEESLQNQYQHLEEAKGVIGGISDVCLNGADIADEHLPGWTSANHAHNSRDYYEYSIDGYQDDVISFNYNVDSESYDHFKAYIIHDDDKKLLVDVSGLNKKGSISYQLPSTASYTLLVEFDKDYSIHKGRDMASVSDVSIRRSSICAIARMIDNYQLTKISIDGTEIAEEFVEDSIADDPIDYSALELEAQ